MLILQGRGHRAAGTARLLFLVAGTLLFGACGPEPPPPKEPQPKSPSFVDDAHVNTPKARRIIAKAKAVLDEKGDLDLARRVLRKAEPFANATLLEEIREVRQRIDGIRAEELVPPVLAAAKGGRCIEAVNKAAEIMTEHRSTTVPAFVRKKVSAPVLECLLGQIEIDVSVGREYADEPNVKRVLDKESYQSLRNRVDEASVQTLMAELGDPIERRQWKRVRDKISELHDRKEAGDGQYDRVIALVRRKIVEEIEQLVNDKIGESTGASGALRKVDTLIKLGDWGNGKTTKTRNAKKPKSVDKARMELAFWVACNQLKCKMRTPQKVWTYGKTPVQPVLKPRGKSLEVIGHSMALWKIADSSTSTLVARSDPGQLDTIVSRLPVAIGWVSNSRLKSTTTAEWLPPGDAIVGTRVWGPLRKGESNYELGTVRAATGGELQVERLADRVLVRVPRGRVHYGTTKKGLKVITFCSNLIKGAEAIIEKVTPTGGDPVATVTCLDDDGNPSGPTRTEQLAALRTKPSWLPARK